MAISGKTRVCGVIGDPIEHTLSPIIQNPGFHALNLDYVFLAFNTDGVGALKALRENGVELKGRKVLLLGAGGAARAIAYAMAKESDELAVLNRTVKQAQALAQLVEKAANKRIVAGSLSLEDIDANLQDSDVLI